MTLVPQAASLYALLYHVIRDVDQRLLALLVQLEYAEHAERTGGYAESKTAPTDQRRPLNRDMKVGGGAGGGGGGKRGGAKRRRGSMKLE